VIQAGFIVGFDNDDERIFDEQYEFIQRSGIAHAQVALLSPIPTTPLYDRLKAEGRLDYSDMDVVFRPKLMSRETLKRGYGDLVRRLYEPEAYFERLYTGYAGSAAFRQRRAERDAAFAIRRGGLLALSGKLAAALQALKLARAAARAGLLRRIAGA
jgi:radical SAM superfamily enzyme YgiQ (UPF0313 family)